MQMRRFLEALTYAAEQHKDGHCKDAGKSPYINHCICVAETLARAGSVTNETSATEECLLTAALLHDTVEKSDTTSEELHRRFGADVAELVAEVTDDQTLPKAEQKRLQVQHASLASAAAKQLKIADKICNVRDLAKSSPDEWPAARVEAYISWSEEVVAGCRGVNSALDMAFDAAVAQTRARNAVRDA